MPTICSAPVAVLRPSRKVRTVRERQVIVSILDLDGPMQVDVKVPEARIKQVRSGQKSRVANDAFPGETFNGLVTEVAPLPDPAIHPRREGLHDQGPAGGRSRRSCVLP